MITLIAILLIICSFVFFLGGAVGMIRLPDFYARLHAAGMLDTMGLFLSMTGLALYVVDEFTLGNALSALKIILIVVFVFITSPTATHAIVDAGVRAGLQPWTREKQDGKR